MSQFATTPPIDYSELAAVKSAVKISLDLNNVTNTADADKPVSTLTQTALNLKANAEDAALTGSATAVGLAVSGTFSAKIGSTANLPLKTGTDGAIEAGEFGTAAGTFCEGDKPVRRDHVLAANGSTAVFENFTNIVVMNVTNAAIMAAWGGGYQANTLYITVPD